MEIIKLPGFGLPVNYMPDNNDHFPTLLGRDSDFQAATLTNRELCMLRFIEEITNKPEWWIKVNDETIASRWKAEALEFDWGRYLKYGDFTPAMADACIEEIKFKAEIYEKTKLLPVYDYTAAIVKSDHLIPDDLWHSLKTGVKALEDIPDEAKDWHPGSNGKVLNLVHPSMYPLVYGKSRVLLGRRIGLAEALNDCGQGLVVEKPTDRSIRGEFWHCTSTNFQWLPCDVSVENGRVKIESYINNLHPVKNVSLYPVIEKFIEKALPAWDIVYRWLEEFPMQRLKIEQARRRCRSKRTCANSDHTCTPLARPTRDDEPRRCDYDNNNSNSEISDSDDDTPREKPRHWREPKRTLKATLRHSLKKTDQSDSEYESEDYDSSEDRDMPDSQTEDEYEEEEEQERDPNHVSEKEVKRRDLRWFSKTHPVIAPEPSPEPQLKFRAEDVKPAHEIFPEPGPKRLQVIVKLANIHLTPENPTYPGGSWHTEGQLNEHICSTALFYYDNENITDSYIDFRTMANADELDEGLLSYEQYDWKTIQRVFAIEWPGGGSRIQSIGSVLTREKRALFFPNVFQHHVNSFKLADPKKPGHRKILALFLVDPAIPVISTANVPPQQKDWWPEELKPNGALPFDEEKAREFRKELMQERSANEIRSYEKMKNVEWNFCEH
ncbi:hypothetical protein FVEN_g6748 [Fusarium venenatum]|uniref:Uncharacterized protein n=1 Tax=Fusarium venenatum TaxID=56646 RepID=A0A2L2T2C1_9HYPO|nr:uncharacterized protein FVRRES_00131 [Fusarium venenatum]KAG8355505.1 hypothetical protein FVEN_g6748 [Fusarium venenatum]CEI63619.1 unnamed protein product [Fusarium venenatum]